MHVKPEEVLHIGDSLISDIDGAKKIGINTCWLNRKRKQISCNYAPDIECYSLDDVYNYLQKQKLV